MIYICIKYLTNRVKYAFVHYLKMSMMNIMINYTFFIYYLVLTIDIQVECLWKLTSINIVFIVYLPECISWFLWLKGLVFNYIFILMQLGLYSNVFFIIILLIFCWKFILIYKKNHHALFITSLIYTTIFFMKFNSEKNMLLWGFLLISMSGSTQNYYFS